MGPIRFREVVRPPRAALERCAHLRAADVANGLGAVALADPAIHRVSTARALVGPAFTVATPPGDNLGVSAACLLAQAGDVVVVDAGGGLGAMVGGLIARLAVERGLAGFVVDGAVRDIDDLERLDLPVFARTVAPHRATKEGPATLGETVRMGGLSVRPGDVVVADRDGVAVIPSRALAPSLEAIERELAIDRASEESAEVLRTRFQGMLARCALEKLPPER
jgi:regulator of RNase E activity RraA